MAYRILTPNDFKRMPWKNGQGITYEIDLESHEDQWLWRLSMAEVEKESSFSEFKSFNRWLSVIQGPGVNLNQISLPLHRIHFFHGETPIQCTLKKGKVTDLGIIFDREKVSAQMDFYSLSKGQTEISIEYLYPLNFIFLCSGKLKIDSLELRPQHCLKIDCTSSLKLDTQGEACQFYLIKILSHFRRDK